jgi:hypothetical protein
MTTDAPDPDPVIAAPTPERSWVIDVCRICSRMAAWPFCEHRAAWPPDSDTAWFEPVTVYERRRR